MLVHLDFYHHILVSDITDKIIEVDIINPQYTRNFLIINIHHFKILLKGVLVF